MELTVINNKLPIVTFFIGFILLSMGCSTVRTDQSKKTDDKESMDLFLLIGQSNMAGRAEITSTLRDTLKNVYLFTGDSWIPAANPINKYSTVRKRLSMQRLGPGYSFAKKLSKCTGKRIGLIVNARGGTAIKWWEKGYSGDHDYNLYEEAVKQAKKAQKYGNLKGVLWLQGSGDKREPEKYMPLLKKLVKDLRHDLGGDFYFLVGEIGKWRQSSIAINRVLRSTPENIKNSGCVFADGLTPLKGDSTNPHFDTRSQLILGQRYADDILDKIYGLNGCN